MIASALLRAVLPMVVDPIIVSGWKGSAAGIERLNSVSVTKWIGDEAELVAVSHALALIPSFWARVQVSVSLVIDALEPGHRRVS